MRFDRWCRFLERGKTRILVGGARGGSGVMSDDGGGD